ncbi:hypothetical protein ACHHYP_20469 [Achlya hypogyna]|uniref:RanBP2-type domain-containing protein n=1 Tax=Achlya hypogyna TaxID=1202772 RepID=A0A1V9YLQ2_ACHHY|nr:hypothetical protein ACHHYP_20469 [Achlya hypogyna]
MSVRLPQRYQCPLCLELLSSPVQLPCCKKHVCLGCFERSIAITSTSCAFCRNRIIGFARRQSNKVDEVLWAEIKAKTQGMTDISFDEDASSATGIIPAKPGELHEYYQKCQSLRAQALEAQETEALEKTLAFLQSDPEFQEASLQTPANATIFGLSSQPAPVFAVFAGPTKPKHTPRPVSKKTRAKPKPPVVGFTLRIWTCKSCTFVNKTNLRTCSMCGLPQPPPKS